jgi:autotransporter-associated beta strand protein
VGQPGKRCPFTVTFPLCRDRFEIEPIPCGSTFHRVDVTVCWEELETSTEALNFSACNGLNWSLSDCDKECATTLVYTGSGATTNANLTLFWDATIQADGSGPLVLESTITQSGTCDRTLTLSGSSDHANEIRRINDPAGSAQCHVIKDGTGRWRLNASSNVLEGVLTVRRGTLQIGNAGSLGNMMQIGGDSGPATVLIEKDLWVAFDPYVLPGSQPVIIGAMADSGRVYMIGQIRIGRPLTLVAKAGGAFEFRGSWADGNGNLPADNDIIFGAAGYEGEFYLNTVGSAGTTTGQVTVAYGSVRIGADDLLVAGGGLTLASGASLRVQGTTYGGIDPTTAVTAGTATLVLQEEPGDPAVSQSLDDLIVTGTLTITGGGDLTVSDLSGSGGITLAAGTLNLSAVTMTGTLSVSGGTANLSQFVTNPGGLATSAALTSSTLTVAFSGAPSSGQQYVLLPGATSSPTSVVLTGTSATGTYSASTSTLTID